MNEQDHLELDLDDFGLLVEGLDAAILRELDRNDPSGEYYHKYNLLRSRLSRFGDGAYDRNPSSMFVLSIKPIGKSVNTLTLLEERKSNG